MKDEKVARMALELTAWPIGRLRRSVEVREDQAPGDYFFGPIRDFLLLGGISLFLLPIAVLLPSHLQRPVSILMTLVALGINGPHFANSYQLMYRDFRAKALMGPANVLRLRYIVAGILVPVALTAFFAACIGLEEFRTLGLAGNAMAFFVGWHYVKQGYGMLIVDSVLKRRFFEARDKKILVLNAYVVWSMTWISVNTGSSAASRYGIDYYLFRIPPIFELAAIAAAIVTGIATGYVLLRRWRSDGSIPVNGVVAYLVTLYLWMIFVRLDPIWLLIVPALHSLQYLTVVWRYESNRNAALARLDEASPRAQMRKGIKGFVLRGVLLGLFGFWLLPIVLEVSVPINFAPDNSYVFFFAMAVFINIHHYFIDNVIWRSENADVKRFLFSRTESTLSAS